MYFYSIIGGALDGESIVSVIVVLRLFYPLVFKIHLSSLEDILYKLSSEIFYIHAHTPVRYVNNYSKYSL